MSFREVVHTADAAIEINSKTIPLLFSDAALGMMSVLYGRERSKAKTDRAKTISVDGCDTETRLVSFLSELLYLNESERLIVAQCAVTFSGDTVSADIRGHTGEPPIKEIKAVTFHNLEIKKNNDGFTATIVFDL